VSNPTRLAAGAIRTVVVHPSAIVRAGLVDAVTRSGGQVAVAAPTISAAIAAGVDYPEMVVVHIDPAAADQAPIVIRELWPMARRVAVIPADISIAGRVLANEAMAAAIAVETEEPEMIVEGLRAVLGGATGVIVGMPEMADGSTSAASAGRAEAAGLTARERELLYLIGEGLSNAQIAEALMLSRKTVETHRTNLAKKLQIPGRAGLIRFAIAEWGTLR